MAKHKGPRYTSKFSYLLEEPIEVNYRIVGYPEWLEAAIPAHLSKKFIPIRQGFEAVDTHPIYAELISKKFMGLDLECSGPKEKDGLDPVSSTSRVILGQFGNRDVIYLVQPELIPYLKKLLQSPKILHINQNIMFDFKWLLKKYGIHVIRMYCTMLAEQLLRAGKAGYGVTLLDLVRQHPPCRLISKQVRGEFINHSGIFTEEQLYYAARDVFLLFDVFLSQSEEIHDIKLNAVAQDEFALMAATAEMELTGVWIDTDVLWISIHYWEGRMAELKVEIKDTFNAELERVGAKRVPESFFDELFGNEDDEESFDVDSPEQKLEALRRIGLTLDNVKRSTLKSLENKLALLLAEYSEVQKIVSTYGQRLVNMIHPDDGRLHPSFHQLGMGEAQANAQSSRDKAATIATGRYSSDFQQLPRPKKIFAKVTEEFELAKVRAQFADKIAAWKPPEKKAA